MRPILFLLPGASLLPDVIYVHIVLATSLISLLHTVLDGGPSKPMTYQHAPRQRVHKYTMSFGDAILYLSRLKSFLNTLGVHLTHRVRYFDSSVAEIIFDSIVVTLS